MPKSEEVDSEELLEGRKSNSVYDFLYQDVRRVGSFLAQFEEHGVRQSIKSTEGTGRAQTVKGGATGTLGLPAVMGASAIVDVATTDDTKDIAEHTFDPLWSNSRRLLDYLSEHELIEKDLWEAKLGRFVLVSGTLSIIDTNILTTIFEDEDLQRAFCEQVCRENGHEEGSPEAIETRRNINLVGRMPKAINLFIYRDGGNAWATLSNESLVTPAHDIAFKHGAAIRGTWSVLGVLDAWPDYRADATDDDPNPQTLGPVVA